MAVCLVYKIVLSPIRRFSNGQFLISQFLAASREMDRLRKCLVETSCQTEMMGSQIESLHAEIDHEKTQVSRIFFSISKYIRIFINCSFNSERPAQFSGANTRW